MTDASADSDAGKPGGKRERTRAALIAATLEVVTERGFAGASLDEIAARAGMTKGAIYSNFGGKGDLMLAAMVSKDLSVPGPTDPTAPLVDQFREIGHQLVAMLDRALGDAALQTEFQLYALTDPDMRRALADLYARSFDGSAGFLAQARDLRPDFPPRDLAIALQAVMMGFFVQSFLSPDEISEAVMVEALVALAKGASIQN
ncbi:TetR/AcrR family transcriptional regulator [Phenylobacterium sp.]|jgi:AcrR family transcriptional regulator|uniref:TetR/AcrR family transcriptional regulator n=1 Tax=Phenylobacterium sp. TaxID=1871053 RepID=UPI002F3E2CE4